MPTTVASLPIKYNGNTLAEFAKRIIPFRLPSDSSWLPNLTIYFVLSSGNKLYYGRRLTQDMCLIDLSNTYGSNLALDTRVDLIYPYWDSLNAEINVFLSVRRAVEPETGFLERLTGFPDPTGATDITPFSSYVNPSLDWTYVRMDPREARNITAIGHAGPDYLSDEMVVFGQLSGYGVSSKDGWNTHQGILSFDDPSEAPGLVVESPAMNIFRNGMPCKIDYAFFVEPPVVTGNDSKPTFPTLIMMSAPSPDYATLGWPYMYYQPYRFYSVEMDNAEGFCRVNLTAFDANSVWGEYQSEFGVTNPYPEHIAQSRETMNEHLFHGVFSNTPPPKGIAFGWGLTYSDEPNWATPEARLHGNIGFVAYYNGAYRVRGDNLVTGPTYSFSNPDGNGSLDAMSNGGVGAFNDMAMAAVAPYPFYCAGTMVVSLRHVWFLQDIRNLQSVQGTSQFQISADPIIGDQYGSYDTYSVSTCFVPMGAAGLGYGWYGICIYTKTGSGTVPSRTFVTAWKFDGSAFSLINTTPLLDLLDDAAVAHGSFPTIDSVESMSGGQGVCTVTHSSDEGLFFGAGLSCTLGGVSGRRVQLFGRITAATAGLFQLSVEYDPAQPYTGFNVGFAPCSGATSRDQVIASADGRQFMYHRTATWSQVYSYSEPTTINNDLPESYSPTGGTDRSFGLPVMAALAWPNEAASGTLVHHPVFAFNSVDDGNLMWFSFDNTNVTPPTDKSMVPAREMLTLAGVRTHPNSGNGYYSAPDYKPAYVVSSPEHGTIVFMRNPFGNITHGWFSSSGMRTAWSNLQSGGPWTRPESGKVLSHLRLWVVDVFVESASGAGAFTNIWLTTAQGEIWVSQSTALTPVKKSTFFAGKRNLRIFKHGDTWFATYQGLTDTTDADVAPAIYMCNDIDVNVWVEVTPIQTLTGAVETKILSLIPVVDNPQRTHAY